MGFFKKIFKPVSKVLDKIIPNEIKPALPYLAAFAPYFGPTSALMGKGIMQRALLSGGLNIGAQLSQEGNEGDINLLSAVLGALSGAMTAPGAADSFAGSRIVGTGADGKAVTASEYAKLSEGANLGGTITTAAEPIAGTFDPGFAKETYDYIQYGKFDTRDLIATTLGGVVIKCIIKLKKIIDGKDIKKHIV